MLSKSLVHTCIAEYIAVATYQVPTWSPLAPNNIADDCYI